MIDQITVFLENKKGRVASVARTIADAGVNMTALSLADSEEYGLARIVCGEPERALKALGEAGYRAKVVKVAAVAVPDRPGGLAELFEALDELDVNIEYCYCFSHRGGAPSGRSRALASRRSRRPTSRQASGAPPSNRPRSTNNGTSVLVSWPPFP